MPVQLLKGHYIKGETSFYDCQSKLRENNNEDKVIGSYTGNTNTNVGGANIL